MTDDDLGEGPVVVKRAAYDAGTKLQAEVDAGARGPAFENAREKAAALQAAGDRDGAAFWEEVFNYLMTVESVSADTQTVVLEDGERWDADNGKVIRPRTRQPRRDRGYRR